MLRCPWRREETSETSKNKNKYKYLHQQQKQPTTVYVICSLCPNQSFRVKNIVIVFNKTTLIFFFLRKNFIQSCTCHFASLLALFCGLFSCYCSYSEASQWLVCFSWVEKNKSKNGQLYIAGLTAVTGFNKFYYVCVCVCVHLLTPACCNFTLFHCWGL